MEFTDATGRTFRTEDIGRLQTKETKMDTQTDTNVIAFTPGQPTASRIVDVTLQEGAPPVAARQGGPSGRSKYEPIFAQVRKLEPAKGWVKVPTTPESHDKDLAHVRTALKRQGMFNADVVKVSTLGGSGKTALCIFIPEGANMSLRDLDAPGK